MFTIMIMNMLNVHGHGHGRTQTWTGRQTWTQTWTSDRDRDVNRDTVIVPDPCKVKYAGKFRSYLAGYQTPLKNFLRGIRPLP